MTQASGGSQRKKRELEEVTTTPNQLEFAQDTTVTQDLEIHKTVSVTETLVATVPSIEPICDSSESSCDHNLTVSFTNESTVLLNEGE